jgi:hypothetical protein
VELLLDEETIREECKRCLRCDLEWLESVGGVSLEAAKAEHKMPA